MIVHAHKFTGRDIDTEESEVQNHLGDPVSSKANLRWIRPYFKKQKNQNQTEAESKYWTSYQYWTPYQMEQKDHWCWRCLLRWFFSVKCEALPPRHARQGLNAPALSLAFRTGYTAEGEALTNAATMFTSLLPWHRNRLRYWLITKRRADMDIVKPPAILSALATETV